MKMTVGDILSSVFGEQTAAAISGAAGGAVRWVALKQGWKDGAASLFVGCLCSIYLSPLVEPLVETAFGRIIASETKRAGLAGFMIGIGGIMVTGLIIDFWTVRRAQIRGDSKKGPQS